MSPRSLAVGFLLVAALAGSAWLLYEPAPVPLAPLPEAPTAAVTVAPSDAHPTLTGLRIEDERRDDGPSRRARNRLVEKWRQALAGVEDGTVPQRAAERIEMDVWLARAQVGEIDDATAHAEVAKLVARELERLRRLREKEFAAAEDVRAAEMVLARERFLAGEDEQDYDARRETYLAERRNHLTSLMRTGLMVREVAKVEIEALEAEFPPASVLRPNATKTAAKRDTSEAPTSK